MLLSKKAHTQTHHYANEAESCGYLTTVSEWEVEDLILIDIILLQNPLFPKSINLLYVVFQVCNDNSNDAIPCNKVVSHFIGGWQVAYLVVGELLYELG